MKVKAYFRKIPGALYIVVLIMLIGSFISPYFLTTSNLIKVLYQSAILLLIASGMTLVITLGEIDLSPGAVLSLASMVTALCMQSGYSPVIAALAGILTGLVCGGINALVIVKAKVPSFVATFGLLGMAQGIALGMRDGATITGLDENFTKVVGGSLGPIPTVVFVAAICFFVIFILLRYSKLGPYFFALGSDKEAAAYAGINVSLYRALPFVIMGLIAGIAGVIFAARLNLGHPTGGIGYEFEAIAAVVVGGNALEGGRSNMFNTLLGVCLLSLLTNSLTLLGLPIWWQLAISGTVLVFALLAPNLLRYQLIRKTAGEQS